MNYGTPICGTPENPLLNPYGIVFTLDNFHRRVFIAVDNEFDTYTLEYHSSCNSLSRHGGSVWHKLENILNIFTSNDLETTWDYEMFGAKDEFDKWLFIESL